MLPRRAPRRRRRHGRVRVAGPGRARRGRVAAELSPSSGFLAVAEWLRGRLAEAERALVVQHRRVAGGRPAHPDRLGLPPPRPGPARPGPPGRGGRHLPAGARGRRSARPAAAARRWHRVRGPGRGGLPAGRARHGPPAGHRGHRAMPRSSLHTAPLATGLATLAWIRQAQGDAAGALEAMGEAGQGRAGPGRGRPAQPGPGAAGAAAAGPGRGRRGRPLDAANAASTRTTSRATRGSRSTWCWPGCCSPRTAPARRSRCWSGCTRRRPPRTGRAASSRSGALQALALAAAGEEDAAVDALARALILACPQGYVRVFADEGAPMAALLARLVAAQKADAGRRPRRPARLPGPGAAGVRRQSPPRRAPGEAPPRRCRAWSSS